MDFDVVQSGWSLARSFFKLAAARRRQYGVTMLYAAPTGPRSEILQRFLARACMRVRARRGGFGVARDV
jgi:hypothetical protein